MKKIYVLVFVCLIYANNLYATGYANIQINPAQPTTNDSVKILFIYYAVNNPAKFFTEQVDRSSFSVFVTTCLGQGQQTAGVILRDTINIGVYSMPGIYYVTLYMNKTLLSDTLCSQSYWYDSAEITFSVSGPNGIVPAASDANLAFSLYPNPTNDKLSCVIDKPTQNATLQLFTPAGRAAAPAMPVTQTNTEIDVSTLPAGLYFLQLQDDKQRVVKKLVKY